METIIKHTKDYDQFVSLLGNRQINKEHTQQLVKEIKRNNLLEYCPIFVNENKEIIDGQHRLDACRILGLKVPYVVIPGLTIKDVVHMNNSQRKWMLQDYVDLHVKHGNKNYIELQEFCEKYQINCGCGSTLLGTSAYSTSHTRLFHEGSFVVTQRERAQEVMETAQALLPFMSSQYSYSQSAFLNGLKHLRRVLLTHNETLEDFVDEVKKQHAILVYYNIKKDYLRQFEQIINKGKPTGGIRLF